MIDGPSTTDHASDIRDALQSIADEPVPPDSFARLQKRLAVAAGSAALAYAHGVAGQSAAGQSAAVLGAQHTTALNAATTSAVTAKPIAASAFGFGALKVFLAAGVVGAAALSWQQFQATTPPTTPPAQHVPLSATTEPREVPSNATVAVQTDSIDTSSVVDRGVPPLERRHATPPLPSQAANTHDRPDEQSLIDGALNALSHGDRLNARTRLEQHEQLYTHGRFVEEREACFIRLLVLESAEGEARTRATAFVAEYPNSLHRRWIAQIAERPGHPGAFE